MSFIHVHRDTAKEGIRDSENETLINPDTIAQMKKEQYPGSYPKTRITFTNGQDIDYLESMAEIEKLSEQAQGKSR